MTRYHYLTGKKHHILHDGDILLDQSFRSYAHDGRMDGRTMLSRQCLLKMALPLQELISPPQEDNPTAQETSLPHDEISLPLLKFGIHGVR
jgi:hypothetical protein